MSKINHKQISYDAIVVGSGISGGWAAMELCMKGFKTLVLERGREVTHIEDYKTSTLHPWDFENGLNNSYEDRCNDPIQSHSYDPGTKQFYVSDKENPYIQETPFNWIRGYQVGGRSLVWGRQCYRMSDLDFEANQRDGHGVDWPIRYKDISPWYDYVERFIGVSGTKEGLKQLPDGVFLPGFELNCIEQHLAAYLKLSGEKRLTIARVANLTREWKGRGPCKSRNLCSRGCPYGAYFSSNSSTLPAAMETGNLTLRPFSVVNEILFDDKTQRATGVRVIDAESSETIEFFAKIIFVNASTIATTALLLNSKSARFPNGLGNDSGQLGHNLMDHHSSAGAQAVFDGYADMYYKGRRPCGFVIPRFQNLGHNPESDFLRGYNIHGIGSRQEWSDRYSDLKGFGKDFKEQLTRPGLWTVWMAGWGECLPYFNNRIALDPGKTDRWKMPLIRINFSYGKNEMSMMTDIKKQSIQILEAAGFKNVSAFNYNKPGGSTVHEMGTARMGADPKTSVLNKHNQLHAVKNVFITDGSCMTSSGSQNPSLTYMALTARACHFAVAKMRRNEL